MSALSKKEEISIKMRIEKIFENTGMNFKDAHHKELWINEFYEQLLKIMEDGAKLAAESAKKNRRKTIQVNDIKDFELLAKEEGILEKIAKEIFERVEEKYSKK